jgi:hypothetical protein
VREETKRKSRVRRARANSKRANLVKERRAKSEEQSEDFAKGERVKRE